MTFEIWTIVGFLGAAQALAVGAALLTTRELRRRLYGLVLTDLGLAMGLITYDHAVRGAAAAWVGVAEDTAAILAPPLFYLFVLLVRRGADSLEALGGRRLALHLAVPAAWLAYAAVLVATGAGGRPPIGWIVAYQVAYTAASGVRAFAPGAGAGGRGGAASERWLRLARVSVGLFLVIHAAQGVRFFVDRPPWNDVVPITAAVCIFALTLVAARQSRVFAAEGAPGPTGRTGPKYEGSTLTEEQAERGLERVRRAFEVERVHLRPDLTLDELAEEVGLPRTHLSQVLNERLGTPFLELVAARRVAEAERLLADPALRHLTVEAVGERAGFQSRSAFYDAFKRRTGRTPGAYRRSALRERPGEGRSSG